jgi:hypothetical protein
MTLYSTLYERALAQITDPLLAQLPEEDLEIMLHDWLMDAIVEPVIGEYDFSDRDEELKQFNFDISDRDQKILSIHMVRAWLAPQIRSVTLTQQVFSGKETKYYAQANQLAEMRALDEHLRNQTLYVANTPLFSFFQHQLPYHLYIFFYPKYF